MSSHLLLCVPIFLFAFVYKGKAYDPLETFESIETFDRRIRDIYRDRSIPLRFYFPAGKTNGQKCDATNYNDANGVIVKYNDDGKETGRSPYLQAKSPEEKIKIA